MYKKLIFLLGSKRKKYMLFLLPFMLLSMFLEMLGVGMIVSVCGLMVNINGTAKIP